LTFALGEGTTFSMKLYAPLLLAIVTATALPRAAEAQSLRFSATAPGGIVGTGNTLGLAKEFNENGPGLRDSIGTFISLGNTIDEPPTNPANPWPMGTTANWMENGSSAVLDLPEAEVLYAELVWGGSFQYGTEDVSALRDTPAASSPVPGCTGFDPSGPDRGLQVEPPIS